MFSQITLSGYVYISWVYLVYTVCHVFPFVILGVHVHVHVCTVYCVLCAVRLLHMLQWNECIKFAVCMGKCLHMSVMH